MRLFGLVALFATIFSPDLAEAKKVSGNFVVSSNDRDGRVHYMSKFACDIGECRYTVRAGLSNPWDVMKRATGKNQHEVTEILNNIKHPSRMVVRVVLDDDYDAMPVDLPACRQADLGRGRTTIQVPLIGTFGNWATNTFRQAFRPHFWYFYAEDCRNTITEQLARAVDLTVDQFAELVPEYEIFYEMEIVQVDGGHLSFEYSGMAKSTIFQLVCYVAVFCWMLYQEVVVMKMQSMRLHTMSQILNAAVIMLISSAIFQLVGVIKSNLTGNPVETLETVSHILSTASYLAVSGCLLLVACGSTLNAPQIYSTQLLSILGAAITSVHILVILADAYLKDSRFTYFSGQGSVGYLLIAFRTALWIIFVLSARGTQNDARTPSATAAFLNRLLVPATVFFLTYPFLIMICSFVRSYHRTALFYHGSFFIQVFALVWLTNVFLSKGEYYKISDMSQSFLPGGMWRPNNTIRHLD